MPYNSIEKERAWRLRNRERRNEYSKERYRKNPNLAKQRIIYLRNRRKNNPWLGHYDCAKTRCTNPNVKCFHRYGKRGIKFFLTTEDVRVLWFKDRAWEMNKPTLDRIDNDGHYSPHNCRFIEKSVNSTKGNYEARWK